MMHITRSDIDRGHGGWVRIGLSCALDPGGTHGIGYYYMCLDRYTRSTGTARELVWCRGCVAALTPLDALAHTEL